MDTIGDACPVPDSKTQGKIRYRSACGATPAHATPVLRLRNNGRTACRPMLEQRLRHHVQPPSSPPRPCSPDLRVCINNRQYAQLLICFLTYFSAHATNSWQIRPCGRNHTTSDENHDHEFRKTDGNGFAIPGRRSRWLAPHPDVAHPDGGADEPHPFARPFRSGLWRRLVPRGSASRRRRQTGPHQLTARAGDFLVKRPIIKLSCAAHRWSTPPARAYSPKLRLSDRWHRPAAARCRFRAVPASSPPARPCRSPARRSSPQA
jgi:hypothetical protein